MGRTKAPGKKQKGTGGVDFKKIKRKIGRKLPPPKNATNTEIKSKAIILPEQSVASEKSGLAVNKKGFTLKELLQQSSHHNAKVRKDALLGIRDLFQKHPEELRLHKHAVIEKLRERISDEDKIVRETVYQLFKSVILPGCEEDNQGALISLIMVYVFNAMTHLSIDVRLMSFKFFDIAVQHFPPAFSSYGEKVLQNYVDILRRNQFQFQDKSKLKIALLGLMRCLSLLPSKEKESKDTSEKRILHSFEPDLPRDSLGCLQFVGQLKELLPVLLNCFDVFIPLVHSQPVVDAQSFDCLLSLLQCIDLVVQFFSYGIDNFQTEFQASIPFFVAPDGTVKDRDFFTIFLKKLFAVFPLTSTHHFSDKDDDRYFILNIVISGIFLNLTEWVVPPPTLLERFLDFIEDALREKVVGKRPAKIQNEKHLLHLLPFIPKLVSTVDYSWRGRLLQAFMTSFKGCSPESDIKIACLYALEEMLLCEQNLLYLDANDGDPLVVSIEELPSLLISLGDANPLCSKVVLHLLLRLGQLGPSKPAIQRAYDNLQHRLQKFYCIRCNSDPTLYGPFVNLPRDCQEISICCLYYFSRLDRPLICAIASCCLYRNLEPVVLFRILEVLQSAYTAGHINIEDLLSFFITLLSQIGVFPAIIHLAMENETKTSNRETFKSVTASICSFLCQMGDQSILFQMLEKVVLDLISVKLPLDNKCALLRMLTAVDSRPTLLSGQSISDFSNILVGYLIDIAVCLYGEADGCGTSRGIQAFHYYLLPSFFMFDRSIRLLKLTLHKLGSLAEKDAVAPFAHHYAKVSEDHLTRIETIVSVFSIMCKDVKLQSSLYSCQVEIDYILQKALSLQSMEEGNMSLGQRHKTQAAVEQLRMAIAAVSARTS